MFWYDYHGVTFDGDSEGVDAYIRHVVEKKIGYTIALAPMKINDQGNGHRWATWELMTDEDLAWLNETLVRSGQPTVTNR